VEMSEMPHNKAMQIHICYE